MEALLRIKRSNQKGIGSLTLIIFGSIIFAIVYAAYNIMPFFYYYLELESHMNAMIRMGDELSDEEIRKRLLGYVRRYEIPADPADLSIRRSERIIEISLPYRETFWITWGGKDYEVYTFEFEAYAQGSF